MKRISNILILLLCLNSLAGQNLLSVVPNQGNQGQTLTVTVSGQNTHFNQGTATYVWFTQGSSTLILPSGINVLSPTQIQSQFTFTYSNPIGSYQVNSYSSADGTLTLPNAFTLNPGANPPSLISVNPNTGSQDQTLTVTISGQNTHFNQGTATNIWFSQGSSTLIYPTSSVVLSPTQIQSQFTFNYSNPSGYYQVNSSNPTDGDLALPDGFLLNPGASPPSLVSVDPSGGVQGQLLSVTISGQNTHFNQATYTTVWFSQGTSTVIYPVSATAVSPIDIEAEFYFPNNYPLGYYQANQTNSIDGLLTLPNSFLLSLGTPPALVSVNPDSGMMGQMMNVSISGQNTHFQQAPCTVSIDFMGSLTLYDLNPTVISNTSLQANLFLSWLFLPGTLNIAVNNNVDGYISLPNSFTVLSNPNPHGLVLVSPDTAEAGPNVAFTIHGTHTNFLSGAYPYVTLQSIYAFIDYSPTVVNDTLMIAYFNLLSSQSGDYTLTAFNSYDGHLTYPGTIYVHQSGIGIEENITSLFNCYPNPFTDELYLNSASGDRIEKIRCFDIAGQVIFIQIPDNQQFPLRIKAASLLPGVYFLEVKSKGQTKVVKVLKQ